MNNVGSISHLLQSSLHAFVYFTEARGVFRTQPNIYDGEPLTIFAKKLHCDVRLGSRYTSRGHSLQRVFKQAPSFYTPSF